MTEINWSELTTYLINVNSLPDDQDKKEYLLDILSQIYPPDLDLNSKRNDKYAGKLSSFIGHIFSSYQSACARQKKRASRCARELLPICQSAIYENLSKFDPDSPDEESRNLEHFLIGKCVNAMLKQYDEDHPRQETATFDSPVNKDNGNTSRGDMTADPHAADPDEMAEMLQENRSITESYFPDPLYSHEEQMLMGLIITQINSNKDLIKWTRDKLDIDPELFKTDEGKQTAFRKTLEGIMLSIVNGNDRNISEAGLVNLLCLELPAMKKTIKPGQDIPDAYTSQYIRCCISRIYRKWDRAR